MRRRRGAVLGPALPVLPPLRAGAGSVVVPARGTFAVVCHQERVTRDAPPLAHKFSPPVDTVRRGSAR